MENVLQRTFILTCSCYSQSIYNTASAAGLSNLTQPLFLIKISDKDQRTLLFFELRVQILAKTYILL